MPTSGLPRRRQTDKTRHLDFAQVANLANAVAFAHHSGHRLTVLMTVLWSHVPGFHEDQLSALTTRLLDRIGRWLRRRAGIELRAVWTRERGHNKGHHLHVLANVPVRELPKMERYLARLFSITDGGLEFSYGKFGMKTLPMQMGSLRYACKSLDHTAFIYRGYDTYNIGGVLGIEHRGSDGVVRIKRAGTTQNIGPKARAAAGWREARYVEEVADLLNPEPFRQKRITGSQRSQQQVSLKKNQRISNARR